MGRRRHPCGPGDFLPYDSVFAFFCGHCRYSYHFYFYQCLLLFQLFAPGYYSTVTDADDVE